MIQPQELRKGNKIIANGLHCGRILTVDRLASKGTLSEDLRPVMFDEHEVGEFLKDCEGVPLTPEILEACGFQKDGFNAFNICISPWPGSHLKQLSFSGDYLYLREGELEKNRITDSLCVLWNNDLRDKMNLHQLQNLFFALTGSELSINLDKVKQPSQE